MEKMYFRTNNFLTRITTVCCFILCLGFSFASHAYELDTNGITLTPNSSFATCETSFDGTATVTATGGVQPYSYQWSTGETFVVAYNLAPGDYQVTVTDATGCVATTTVTVSIGPEGIWLMPTSTPASCGSCDGTAQPHAMLGAPPYTYQWSDGQTTEVATGLCPGEYSVTVSDIQGCQNSTTVFVGSEGNLNVNATSTDAGCSGNDGTATANPTGGMAPYTYSWSNGGNTQTISGLSPGTYTVTVTSADGCVGITTVTVGGGPSTINVTASSNPTECGSTDGTASVNASGGNAPYTYSWSTGGTTQTISGLAPGVYTVTVTDASGCSSVVSVQVDGSSAPTAGTISTNDPTTICAGDGIPDPITVNVLGSTQGVSTQWVVTDANGNILALPGSNTIDLDGAGDGLCLIWYLVYDGNITGAAVGNNANDIEGCFDLSNNIPVTRTSTTPPTISTTDPTTVCVGDMEDDFINVSVDDAGMGSNSAWVITDANGVILGLPAAPPFNFEDAGLGNCLIWYLNFEDGLSGAEVGANANDLQGCFSLSTPIEVVRVDAGMVTISPEDPTICPGEEVTLTATSNVNATYEWFAAEGLLGSPNEASTTFTMMEEGTYQIIVSTTTDDGCMGMAMTTVTVSNGEVVTIVDDPNGNTICPGESLDLSVANASDDVTYTWSATAGMIVGDGGTATYTMMMPGSYTVTVDAVDNETGCSSSSSTTVVVEANPEVTIVDDPNGNTICPGESLSLGVDPVTDGVTYTWSADAGMIDGDGGTATYTMMMPGTYTITVDAVSEAGCMGSATTTVVVGEAPDATITDDPNGNTICQAGESLSLSTTEVAGVTYTWSADAGMINGDGANATYTMMMPGTYTITLEAVNADGCTSTSTTTAEVGIFDITVEETSPISACGESDAVATVTTNGGNGSFSIEWGNGSTDASISDLAAGTYTVTVVDDATGCVQEGSITIEEVGISIGNYVWLDNSEDCLQDDNESGLEGVPVNLMGPGPDGIACNDDDEILESTNTDENGLYLFECIAPGTYYIQFFATIVYNNVEYTCIDGDGTGASTDPMSNDDNNDSDVDPETGKTMPFDVLDVDGDGIPETIDMNADGINDKDPLSFDAGVVEICNNVNTGGQVEGTQEICAGEVPTKIMSVVPAGGGGNAPIEYLWICSPTSGVPNPDTWIAVPNSNSECLELGATFETRYYARCARREGCPEFVFESNVVCIEVIACSQIITFNTNMMNDETVQVSWITDNDVPGAMYNVERSADGANFETLTEIPSQAKDLSLYNYIDESPMKGMNYYRIKRVDQAGNYTFSEVSQEMNISNAEANFDIFPNPVSSDFTLENLSLIEGDVQVEIISTTGSFKKGLKMDASSYNKSVINTDELPSGVYFLRISHSAGQVDLIKFTKLN